MVSLSEPAAGVPVLALVTTLHVALAAVRNHRSAARSVSSLAVASGGFAVLPWVLASVPGLLLGLALHACWFVVCERWVAPPLNASPPAAPAPVQRARPAPTARSTSRPAATRADFSELPVLSVVDETADIRTFRLSRPPAFEFCAGQFIAVRLRVEGQEHVRCYSISSPPDAHGYLEISVKRHGVVSNALHATLRPGSLLAVRAPAGQFKYPAGDDRPLILLAGGVGITPIMSMVRHAALNEPGRPVTLLYSARRAEDLAFREEIVWLARRSARLAVTFAVTRGAAPSGFYPGRIDEALIGTIPDAAHSIALMCGPQAFIDTAGACLAAAGVPAAQIRFERFDMAVAASRDGGSGGGRQVTPDSGGAFRVRTAPSGQEMVIEPGQTLLEAAERHGLEIPSLCRAGVCGTCRTRVLEGEVDCTSSLLDAEDRNDGYVLACVTSAQSDCVIEG